MPEDDSHATRPLAVAASALEEVLLIHPRSLAWIKDEFGSPCEDSVRHKLACSMMDWLEGMLRKHLTFNLQTVEKILHFSHELRPLITTSEMVHRTPKFELIRTARIECPCHPESNLFRAFAALAFNVAKPENHGCGYHLHPIDQDQRHLGYKLLFDPKHSQQFMSWESHGQGAEPWGKPTRKALGSQRAKDLHRGALRSIRGSIIAPKGARFSAWSSQFEKPGATAYIAHPTNGAVSHWPPA